MLLSQNALDSQIRWSQVFFFFFLSLTTCITSKVPTFIKAHSQQLSSHSLPQQPCRDVSFVKSGRTNLRTVCLNKISLKNIRISVCLNIAPVTHSDKRKKKRMIIYHGKTDENPLSGVNSIKHPSHISVSYWSNKSESAHMHVMHKCRALMGAVGHYFITAEILSLSDATSAYSVWFFLVLKDIYIHLCQWIDQNVPGCSLTCMPYNYSKSFLCKPCPVLCLWTCICMCVRGVVWQSHSYHCSGGEELICRLFMPQRSRVI